MSLIRAANRLLSGATRSTVHRFAVPATAKAASAQEIVGQSQTPTISRANMHRSLGITPEFCVYEVNARLKNKEVAEKYKQWLIDTHIPAVLKSTHGFLGAKMFDVLPREDRGEFLDINMGEENADLADSEDSEDRPLITTVYTLDSRGALDEYVRGGKAKELRERKKETFPDDGDFEICRRVMHMNEAFAA